MSQPRKSESQPNGVMEEDNDIPAGSDMLFDAAENIYFRAIALFKFAQDVLQVKWEAGKKFAVEHPIVTLFTLVALAMCFIPILCFCTFALASMVFMFTAFIFVEGFLLTAGALFLGGVMCVVVFLSLGCSALLTATAYTFIYAQRWIAHFRTRATPSSATPNNIGSHID